MKPALLLLGLSYLSVLLFYAFHYVEQKTSKDLDAARVILLAVSICSAVAAVSVFIGNLLLK